jgi:hypothetical protein
MALHGNEGRSRPGQRERGGGRLVQIRLVPAGRCRLGRTARHQADLHGLRFDDHAINMTFDQVAVPGGDRKLG